MLVGDNFLTTFPSAQLFQFGPRRIIPQQCSSPFDKRLFLAFHFLKGCTVFGRPIFEISQEIPLRGHPLGFLEVRLNLGLLGPVWPAVGGKGLGLTLVGREGKVFGFHGSNGARGPAKAAGQVGSQTLANDMHNKVIVCNFWKDKRRLPG